MFDAANQKSPTTTSAKSGTTAKPSRIAATICTDRTSAATADLLVQRRVRRAEVRSAQTKLVTKVAHLPRAPRWWARAGVTGGMDNPVGCGVAQASACCAVFSESRGRQARRIDSRNLRRRLRRFTTSSTITKPPAGSCRALARVAAVGWRYDSTAGVDYRGNLFTAANLHKVVRTARP